jgi:hypothetical protein
LPEQLIEGREDIFFGYEFAIQGGTLPDEAIDCYVRTLSNPESLRGSLVWSSREPATGSRRRLPTRCSQR